MYIGCTHSLTSYYILCFRFFISSKLLLKSAINVQKIHTDATYKLVWQGYPILQIGTTDLYRKYHPFGLAVCTHETHGEVKFIFGSLKKTVSEKIGLNKTNNDHPNIDLKLWTSGYNWAKSNVAVCTQVSEERNIYRPVNSGELIQ